MSDEPCRQLSNLATVNGECIRCGAYAGEACRDNLPKPPKSVRSSLNKPSGFTRFSLDKTPRHRQPPNKADGKLLLSSPPRVTRDEALELMVHHLQLAAMYYEATSHDESAVAIEVNRIMSEDVIGFDPPGKLAAQAWLRSMNDTYGSYKNVEED